MRVIHFPCAPPVNESERKAFIHIKNCLQSYPGDDLWILLTNLAFSVTHQLQSDEIDIVAIGPQGARVIEVKHWTAQWIDAHRRQVEIEADRVTNKARKIGTTLKRAVPGLPHVEGAILFTQEAKDARLANAQVRGVRFHSLKDWQDAIGLSNVRVLAAQQITVLGRTLEPKSSVAINGSLRRLAGYINLELLSNREERFHRVYKGSHPARRDRIVLHLYDLSATDEKNAEAKAKREFEALHRLQLHAWAPRILDSYQEAPGYAGEMFFFTVVDPAAPSIEQRSTDRSWTSAERLDFARSTVRAVRQLHQSVVEGLPIVHRNLTPKTILVRHDNSPILTGFDRTRIPSEVSVASLDMKSAGDPRLIPPEIKAQGLAAADCRSDTYSLCRSLEYMLEGCEDELSCSVVEVVERGVTDDPGLRCSLEDLDSALSELLGDSAPRPLAPPARFWTEEQVVRFRDRDYKIISRLGSGGLGTAFKVLEIDRSIKEELGTYVGKVVHDSENGQCVLRSYRLARSHLGRHPGLSTIFEVAREWQPNDFIALMTWVEGTPLGEFTGVFPLLAEDQQEISTESLGLRWICGVCDALDVLHRNGLVHGDVSPRNLIVSGSELVLTDYDFITKIGERITAPATVLYCSPSYLEKRPASPSDDIYALAAGLFHVIFEKEPFRHGGEFSKSRGLNWDSIDRAQYPVLASFLDQATHPDPTKRFSSTAEAFKLLKEAKSGPIFAEEPQPTPRIDTPGELREERLSWLLSLLQSFPGSRWGNSETRGLDTDFAAQTYVPTALEETLLSDIPERRVRLVILCGNAGDGKTALLQHLMAQLKLGRHPSGDRIIDGMLSNGLTVRVNLDGSAAWRGRSADELLDEFLEPFQSGAPKQDIVHLLAINDGRLLEWIGRQGDHGTALTEELSQLLRQEEPTQSHVRFISLNQRSLIGGITLDHRRIETKFLDSLIDHLYGSEDAINIWSPCKSCSAQARCEVLRAARVFGPTGVPGRVQGAVGARARRRLSEALQAVHLRGETHITMRELC